MKFYFERRAKQNWDLHQIPTIHSEKNKNTVSFAVNNRIKKTSEINQMNYKIFFQLTR